MSNEELMKPRYKVIADYPGQRYAIGDVIETYESAMCYAIGNTPHCEPEWSEKVCLADYPAIFRELEWWEYIKPEDMPEYIKFTKDYGKFKEDSVYKYEAWGLEYIERQSRGYIHFRSGPGQYDLHCVSGRFHQVYPATLEEYTSYINQ